MDEQIDVALAIDYYVPAAKYYGSTTANTEECFAALDWFDERSKPTWEMLLAAPVQDLGGASE